MRSSGKVHFLLLLALLVLASVSQWVSRDAYAQMPPSPDQCSYAGVWQSLNGLVTLTQEGDFASGTYTGNGGGTIEGNVSAGCIWQGTYLSNNGTLGNFRVQQTADGQFTGRSEAGGQVSPFNATRQSAQPPANQQPVVCNYAGTWLLDNGGTLTLTQQGNRARGTYTVNNGSATIEGRVNAACTWVAEYVSNDGARRGTFNIQQNAGGQTFAGRLDENGTSAVVNGTRSQSQPRASECSWAGMWLTDAADQGGVILITQTGNKARGTYAALGGGTMEGTTSSNCTWTGTWVANDGVNRGTFEAYPLNAETFSGGKNLSSSNPTLAVFSGRRITTPSAGSYAGCFADDASRDLKDFPFSSGSMSIEFCSEHCRAFFNVYAGTQFGSYCFCGNTVGRLGAADESRCSIPCSGNPGQKCGGEYANSVRRVN